MKTYVKPEIEEITFVVSDVVTLSTGDEGLDDE